MCSCPNDWVACFRRDCDRRPPRPLGTITIPPLTKDQEEYLRKIEEATGKYDRNYVVGGPKKCVCKNGHDRPYWRCPVHGDVVVDH